MKLLNYFMKSNIKYLIVFIVVIISFYLYKLNSLAIEGNKIFEVRCTKVNPPLIAYKNSFISFTDALKTPNKYTDNEVKKFFYDYIEQMRSYVPEETKWLEINQKYLNRWDFKLIEPWYIKQAGEYQQKMYEGYRDDAKYMLEVYDSGGTNEELQAKFQEARDRRDEFSQKYFELFDRASEIRDIRKIFSNVPVPSGCTEENITIPNTYGALDTKTPEPSSVPINPEITS